MKNFWIPRTNAIIDRVKQAEDDLTQAKEPEWQRSEWQSAPFDILPPELQAKPMPTNQPQWIPTHTQPHTGIDISGARDRFIQEAEAKRKETQKGFYSPLQQPAGPPTPEQALQASALPFQIVGATLTAPFREGGVPQTAPNLDKALQSILGGESFSKYIDWQDPRIYPWQDVLTDAYRIKRKAEGADEAQIENELASGVNDLIMEEGKKTPILGQGVGVKDIAENAPDIGLALANVGIKAAPILAKGLKTATQKAKPALKELATSEAGFAKIPGKEPSLDVVSRYKSGVINNKDLTRIPNGEVIQEGDIGFVQPGAKPFKPTPGLKYDETNMHPIYRVNKPVGEITPKVEPSTPKVEQPLNMAPKAPPEPLVEGAGMKPPVTPARPVVGGVEPNPEFAGNIRLAKFPKEVHGDLLKWSEDTVKVEMRRRGVRSHDVTMEAVQKLADKTGGDPKKMAKPLGSAYNAEEIKAIDGMLTQADKELQRLKGVIDAGQNDSANMLRLRQTTDKVAYWTALATSSRAEAGRALESFKIINKALKSNDVRLMEKVIKQAGGRENMDKVMEAMKGLDWNNPVAINNFIRSINKPKLKDYFYEVFVNGILSGPKTHIVNSMSNAVTAVISPIETVGGAVVETGLAKLSGRASTRYLNEAVYEAAGSLQGFRDGVRGAVHTLKYGVRPDALSKYEFRPSAFSGKLGRAVNFPTTALEAADELFYNVNYRMALNKTAYRAAKSRGLSGQNLIDDMAGTLSNPADEMIEEAAKQAQYRVFRQEAGRTTQKITSLRDDIPFAKYFVPFLRTPVNLWKFGMERSPLGFANPKLWRNLKTKNPEAADQLARAFLGSAVATSLFFYAKEGNITGGVPTSASARDRFYAEGKQPYALKILGKWVSYQRAEPFNQVFSQVAALVDAVSKDDKTVEEKFGIVAKDIGQNIVSQTYMSGISDFFDAIADPERYGASFAIRLAGSMLPYSAASRTAAQMMDTTIRKPTNPLEGVEANIPGLSQNVPAYTNSKGIPQIRQSPAWSPINVTEAQGGGGGLINPFSNKSNTSGINPFAPSKAKNGALINPFAK